MIKRWFNIIIHLHLLLNKFRKKYDMDRNIILYNMDFTHFLSKSMNHPPKFIIGIYFVAVHQSIIKMNLSILRDS